MKLLITCLSIDKMKDNFFKAADKLFKNLEINLKKFSLQKN